MKKLFGIAKDAASSWNQKDRMESISKRSVTFAGLVATSNVERWQINVAVHYNAWENLQRSDFEPVVAAFRNLVDGFLCSECKDYLRVSPERDGIRVERAPEVTIRGFQNTDDTANTFVLRKPDEGASAKMGVNACTGLIRITAFVGKSSEDKFKGTISMTGDPGSKVSVEHGKTLGHVVQGRVETKVLGPKLVLAVLQQVVLSLHGLLKDGNGLDHLPDLISAISVTNGYAALPRGQASHGLRNGPDRRHDRATDKQRDEPADKHPDQAARLLRREEEGR